jgi:hypothetical protein
MRTEEEIRARIKEVQEVYQAPWSQEIEILEWVLEPSEQEPINYQGLKKIAEQVTDPNQTVKRSVMPPREDTETLKVPDWLRKPENVERERIEKIKANKPEGAEFYADGFYWRSAGGALKFKGESGEIWYDSMTPSKYAKRLEDYSSFIDLRQEETE